MAGNRTKLIVGAGLVVVAGAAAFFLTSGDQPVLQSAASQSTIRVEAAGVNYAGWPEMGVSVNGKSIGNVTIDSAQRKMFEVSVPGDVGEISTIQISFTNYTEPQSYVSDGAPIRSIIFRGIYLNDEKLEGGEPSGKKNTLYSLQTSEGGITWNIGG